MLAEVLPVRPEPVDGGIRLGNRAVPLRGGVLRFREDDGYNNTFALQWNRFRTNQIDSVNGTDLSMRRFAEAGWRAKDLAGKSVLEAGCGAGRFTRILAEAGARIVTFDYSAAIDASHFNNGRFRDIAFLQADIFALPFRPETFDYVFCYGVLQHTPDPKAAFMVLSQLVKSRWAHLDRYLSQGRADTALEIEIYLAAPYYPIET